MSTLFQNLLTSLQTAHALEKSIVSNPQADIDVDTADFSLDNLASRPDQYWIDRLSTLMSGADYGEIPRETWLPNHLKMYVSKVDDGIYSAIIRREDPGAGDRGEVQTHLQKMTLPSMVQALKAKNYVPTATAPTPESAEISSEVPKATKPPEDYRGLWNALKRFQGDLHIHLAKALSNDSEPG